MGFFSNILESAKTAQASPSVVGIDIGSSAIKVVELEDRNDVLTLLTYGEIQLGPYANQSLGAAVHLDPKQEQEALVDVIRESAVKSKNGVFAMPLSASFISTTAIQADADADLSAQVRVEARKIIPASLSEVTLDWAELDTSASGTTGRQVLIAAIQNAAIEKLNILMQFVGMAGSPTEIECFSAARTITKGEHTAIIDFGASSAKMYLLHNGVLQRMHRINTGGTQITRQFANEKGIEFEEAELLKLQLSQTNKIDDVLRSVYKNTYSRPLREFRQVIQHYQSDRGITFDTIHVCGGAGMYSAVEPMIKEALGLSVTHINPFSSVAYPAFMEDAMAEIGPSFVPALGAALRHFE